MNYVDDPYAHCEHRCLHDLARGVSVEDLLGPDDGPYPSLWETAKSTPAWLVAAMRTMREGTERQVER